MTMKLRSSALLILVLFVAGCSDNPTSNSLETSVFNVLSEVDSVEIMLGAESVDTAFVVLDGTLQLNATPLDPENIPLTERGVEWSSNDPALATVDSAGLIRGESAGAAVITATSADVSTTVVVRVISCATTAVPSNPAVGEVITTEGSETQLLCLDGGADGAEYLYVPFNASDVQAERLAVEIAGGNVLPPTGLPSPAVVSSGLLRLSAAPNARSPDREFHRRLREFEVRELTPLIPSARAARVDHGVRYTLSAAEVPASGDTVPLNVPDVIDGENLCLDPIQREARIAAVSDHAIIALDTENPPNNITDAEFRSIAETFDALVYPVDTNNFGEPTDLDDNQRVIIYYTEVVNRLTEPDSDSFVGGFFFGGDLFPPDDPNPDLECPASNFAEIFYMLAPDPTGELGTEFGEDFIRRITVGTVGHEFQHLINASRRIYVNNANSFEEVWLNEGLSHIAEELLFYEASGLEPRQNIDIETLRSAERILDAVNTYQVSNLGRFISYLSNPDEESLLGQDNLPTRGAIWAFLRYAADQEDGPDQPFWFDLVNSTTTGVANLNQVLEDFGAIDLMQSWTVSVYTDDAVPVVPPLFMQPSWNYREILPALTGDAGFPLAVRTLVSGEERTFNLRAGGAAFVRFGVAANSSAILTTTSGGIVPPDELRISIVRIR